MRIVSGLIAALLLTVAPCFAANEDGSAVAVLDGGRTLVPVRAISEWLDAHVQWHAPTEQIVITRAGTTVHLRLGSAAALLDGEAVVLDAPPVVLAGITYVPARFVAEAFGAAPSFDGTLLTLTSASGRRSMDLRVAVLGGDWLTYRGPWFDIDYPASFRPLGYDRAPRTRTYDENGMRFGSPDGTVEFYVYSPQWSGNPGWIRLAPGETVFERHTATEGSGIEKKQFTWVTIVGPTDDYTRSWVEIAQPDVNVKYYFGIRYETLAAYDRWHAEYETFKASLVQYAD